MNPSIQLDSSPMQPSKQKCSKGVPAWSRSYGRNAQIAVIAHRWRRSKRPHVVACRWQEAPINKRLEGGAERVPGVDRSIEASLAQLDGAHKSHRTRGGP